MPYYVVYASVHIMWTCLLCMSLIFYNFYFSILLSDAVNQQLDGALINWLMVPEMAQWLVDALALHA